MTPEQQTILNFLLGSGDIDGIWFGDEHPADRMPMNWWRERLRKAFLETKEPGQEPVAWMTHGNDPLPMFHGTKAAAEVWGANPQPLYTAPPRREWVGLTDEEIMRAAVNACDSLNITRHFHSGGDWETICDDDDLLDIARAIEAKLKEKNNDN